MIDGNPATMDVPPIEVADRTLVPLRFLEDALGAQVTWVPDSDLVAIQTSSNSSTDSTQTSQPQALHSIDVKSMEVIPATLDTQLSSTDSHVGDMFTATVQTGENGDYASIPSGTKIEGHVAAVQPMSGDQPAILDLAFARMILPSGATSDLNGSLVSLDDQYVMQDDSGTYQAKDQAMTYPKMVFVGYGSGSGMLVGVNDSSPMTGSVLDSSLAYIRDQVPTDEQQAEDVTLTPGTTIGIRLDQTTPILFE